MSDSAQRAVLVAAVERLFEGTLPSRWVEREPLTRDLVRVIQPMIAVRETEAHRVRRWRYNAKRAWLRKHPDQTVVPEWIVNMKVPPRSESKPMSLSEQERSGRNSIVRKTLNNNITFEKKTVNGVKYIRLLQIPHPLRGEERFKVK